MIRLLQLMPPPPPCATHTHTTSACSAAVCNVVPADVDTNALSTSETMDNELEFLLSLEAALLVGPVVVVLAWQAFVMRGDIAALCLRRADPVLTGPARDGPLEELLREKPQSAAEFDGAEGGAVKGM